MRVQKTAQRGASKFVLFSRYCKECKMKESGGWWVHGTHGTENEYKVW